MISVVVPTIKGRGNMFAMVANTYLQRTPHIELIVAYGHPTVGDAWQWGASRARGDYIHLGNDDCRPHEGWWQPAVEACDAGFIPSPMVYDVASYPQSLPEWGKVAPDWTPVHCSMIPFLSRAQWEAVQPLFTGHYSTDNFITWRAERAGWPCRLRTGYAFTHHWAQPGRGAGMTEVERMTYDAHLFEHAKALVEAGAWDKPWPEGGRA